MCVNREGPLNTALLVNPAVRVDIKRPKRENKAHQVEFI